ENPSRRALGGRRCPHSTGDGSTGCRRYPRGRRRARSCRCPERPRAATAAACAIPDSRRWRGPRQPDIRWFRGVSPALRHCRRRTCVPPGVMVSRTVSVALGGEIIALAEGNVLLGKKIATGPSARLLSAATPTTRLVLGLVEPTADRLVVLAE